jgi:hypothetical protein
MNILINGTRDELDQLFPDWNKISKLIQVDYLNMHLVPSDEVFTLTEVDFIRAGMIVQPIDS